MLGTHDPWLFALTVLVLNATPGVDLIFTLTRTLQYGVRPGAAAAMGIAAGCVVHTLAAAFGLAALLAASSAAFNVVKWAGALYLLWLAWGMLRTAMRGTGSAAASAASADAAGDPATLPQSSAAQRTAPTLLAIFRQGLLTNALNPKVALFFLALLPQFISGDAPHKAFAFLFLGAWFVIQGGAFLLLFVVCVAPLRRWRAPHTWVRTLYAGGAGLFAVLAARLALAQRAG
ncbi:MAG: LysE family translocator [Burkholderiaceae bacterium]